MQTPPAWETLKQFRLAAYRTLGHRKDSLFELMEAVLAGPGPATIVRLSLAAVFRRAWPSAPDALADGGVDTDACRRLVQSTPIEPGVSGRPVGAGAGPRWLTTRSNAPPRAALPIDVLVRLRSTRVFYRAPGPYQGRGAPRKYGEVFRLADPVTHGASDASAPLADPQCGQVQIDAWRDLRATGAADAPVTIVRVQLERLPRRAKPPAPLWLACLGDELPADLGDLWRGSLLRFTVEHGFRFLKQALGWTAVRPRDPAAADRWTRPGRRRPGQRARPRKRGHRRPTPKAMAAGRRRGDPLPLTRYGRSVTPLVFGGTARWYGALRDQPVRIVLVRDPSGRRRDAACFWTDLTIDPAFMLTGYAQRGTIEVAFHDQKQFLGFEDPQNQAATAVARTAPMAGLVYDLVLLWYAARLSVTPPGWRQHKGGSRG